MSETKKVKTVRWRERSKGISPMRVIQTAKEPSGWGWLFLLLTESGEFRSASHTDVEAVDGWSDEEEP